MMATTSHRLVPAHRHLVFASSLALASSASPAPRFRRSHSVLDLAHPLVFKTSTSRTPLYTSSQLAGTLLCRCTSCRYADLVSSSALPLGRGFFTSSTVCWCTLRPTRCVSALITARPRSPTNGRTPPLASTPTDWLSLARRRALLLAWHARRGFLCPLVPNHIRNLTPRLTILSHAFYPFQPSTIS